MEVEIGAAKIKKYATSQSGDTLEFIERPGGGISLVLADGQRSGKSAKVIANKVVSKVISLLSDGVRDGAAARAASDYLFHEREGKVMATLNILSVDMRTKTIVVTRNNPAPVFIFHEGRLEKWDEDCLPVGTRLNVRPTIRQIDLTEGVVVIMFTDGITNAGVRIGRALDIDEILQESIISQQLTASEIANNLLNDALIIDENRPCDDISIVALRVTKHEGFGVRKVSIQLPLSPY